MGRVLRTRPIFSVSLRKLRKPIIVFILPDQYKASVIKLSERCMMNSLQDYFLLDPSVTFLNHGSFGATPKPVFKTYQRWQRELERQLQSLSCL